MSSPNDTKNTDNPDYSEFHQRIEKYIKDAETYLKLPADAIGNTWFESDFGFVLKMCGVIEPLLKEAVRERVRSAIEHPKVATSGSDALLKAIGDLGVDRRKLGRFPQRRERAKTRKVAQPVVQFTKNSAHLA